MTPFSVACLHITVLAGQQVENHVNPVQTLKRLRTETLAAQQDVDIRLRLAEILSRANLFSAAVVDFAAASALAPDRSDLPFDLAVANFRASCLDDALASAERARRVADTSSLESLVGDIQEKRGDPLAAVHTHQAAVTLEPSEECYHLALVLNYCATRHLTPPWWSLSRHPRFFPNRFA